VLPKHNIAGAPLHRAALEAAPETEGNAATLLAGGARAVAAQLAAIGAARDSIHMEFYMLEDIALPSGETLFALLARKAAEGVAVAVTYDGIGSGSTSRAALDGLRGAGVRLVSFNPVNPLRARAPWRPNHRTHRKLLVVDGRVGFTGGVNFSHVYANPCGPGATDPEQDADAACWDDAALRLQGPAVAQLQRLFLASWARQGGAPLPPRDWFPPSGQPGRVRARILGSSPGEGEPFFHAVRLAALEGARRRAWFATGYLVPTPRELAELAAAARRGVDVRLLLPRAGDHPVATHAQRATYAAAAGGRRPHPGNHRPGDARQARAGGRRVVQPSAPPTSTAAPPPGTTRWTPSCPTPASPRRWRGCWKAAWPAPPRWTPPPGPAGPSASVCARPCPGPSPTSSRVPHETCRTAFAGAPAGPGSPRLRCVGSAQPRRRRAVGERPRDVLSGLAVVPGG
jgi:hypothetical protein